jgi:hypothetical protein
MWREMLDAYPLTLRRLAADHKGWGSEPSRVLIYPRQPVGLWRYSDSVCIPFPHPIVVGSDREQDQLAFRSDHIMTANEFEPLDANVVKADHDNRQVPVPYQYDYQTAVRPYF